MTTGSRKQQTRVCGPERWDEEVLERSGETRRNCAQNTVSGERSSVQIRPAPPKPSNSRASALPKIGRDLAFSSHYLMQEREYTALQFKSYKTCREKKTRGIKTANCSGNMQRSNSGVTARNRFKLSVQAFLHTINLRGRALRTRKRACLQLGSQY